MPSLAVCCQFKVMSDWPFTQPQVLLGLWNCSPAELSLRDGTACMCDEWRMAVLHNACMSHHGHSSGWCWSDCATTPPTSAEPVIPCALEVGERSWRLYLGDLINHYEKEVPEQEMYLITDFFACPVSPKRMLSSYCRYTLCRTLSRDVL